MAPETNTFMMSSPLRCSCAPAEVEGSGAERIAGLGRAVASSTARTERRPRSDLRQGAAVDDPFGAGNLARQRGDEVGDYTSNIVGLADAPGQQRTGGGPEW